MPCLYKHFAPYHEILGPDLQTILHQRFLQNTLGIVINVPVRINSLERSFTAAEH